MANKDEENQAIEDAKLAKAFYRTLGLGPDAILDGEARRQLTSTYIMNLLMSRRKAWE